MDKGCSPQNLGHTLENSTGFAGNYGEYPNSDSTKMEGG
jgi:hypothetical protein